MQAGKLTTVAVRRLMEPGRYADGGNLYLFVRRNGSRLWTFRYQLPGGKAQEMSLGPVEDVTLAEARDLARDARRIMATGRSPIEARREAARTAEGAGMTFGEAATLYMEGQRPGWKNKVHDKQWTSTLNTYAVPVLGKLPVGRVGVSDVLAVLEPIWKTKTETASRLRGRLEAVLDFATARGWRTGENPARWKGHLSHSLPRPSKLAAVKHHAALPWQEAPAFMRVLDGQPGTAAQALRFTILTAARTSEATGATWGEVDLDAKVWTVPGERMKAGAMHRVPLSPAVLSLLRELRPDETPDLAAYVFPGGKATKPLSNMAMTALLRRMKRGDLTVHGFRSTFRDWCGETRSEPREVAEAALAHTLRDKVEAAYRRGDGLERRAVLMAAWADYLARPAEAGAVVAIRTGEGAVA